MEGFCGINLEKIKPQNTHLLSGMLKKPMAVNMRISTSSWGHKEGDLVTSVNILSGESNMFGFILHSTQRHQ